MKKLARILAILSGIFTVLSVLVLILAKLDPAVTISRAEPDPGDSDEASVSPDETVYFIEHLGRKLKPAGLSLLSAGLTGGVTAAVLELIAEE